MSEASMGKGATDQKRRLRKQLSKRESCDEKIWTDNPEDRKAKHNIFNNEKGPI